MYIKEFEPHLFSIDREEYNTLSVCVSHLNYQNFPNKKNNYESYQQHHHKYVPHVQIGSVKSKIQDSKSTGQITFIEPEIRWLCRSLKELAELSLEDTENSLDDTTEEGTWALDYAKVQLNILTAFRNAMDESEPDSLWNLYDDLNESEY